MITTCGEFQVKIEDYRKKIRAGQCRFCKFEGLNNEEIRHYDHAGGYKVDGMSARQWLFIVCPQCEYEWVLWKLGVK